MPVAVSHNGITVALLRKSVGGGTAADPPRLVDIELYDTATGTIRRLPGGAESSLFDRNSFPPTFSADGKRPLRHVDAA